MKKLFIIASLAYFGVSTATFSANDRLNLGVWVQEKINDDPSLTYTTVKPAFFYALDSEKVRLTALVAFLFNRLETRVKLKDSNYWLDTGVETRFIIAGDAPRIDGTDYSDDEFKAHQLMAYGGVAWNSSLLTAPLVLRSRYRLNYFNPYDFASNPGIIEPESFINHGPEVLIEWGDSAGPFEILDRGSRLHHHSRYQWRSNASAWGRPAFLSSVDRYYEGSIGVSIRKSLDRNFDFMARAQASYVSKADRLNALQDGSLSQEGLGLCLGDYKSDRAETAELMLKWMVYPDRSLMIAPLGHWVALREVTPTEFRSHSGGGAGLKISGLVERKIMWDITYANLFGYRPDLNGIHEVKLMFNYSLF